MRTGRKRVLIAMLATAIIGSALAPGATASEVPADTFYGDKSGDVPEFDEAVRSLVRTFGLPVEKAQERIRGQSDHFAFRGETVSELGGLYGGSRYDVYSGIETVLVTDVEAARAVVEDLGRRHGVEVNLLPADYSYDALVGIADALNQGRFAPGPVSAHVDYRNNTVVVAIQSSDGARMDDFLAQRASLESVHPAIRVVSVGPNDVVDEVCTSKTSCGVPLRGGIALWRGDPSNYICSLGFTAHATDSSRWAITAGHCADDLNEVFGHGEQAIGAVRQIEDNSPQYPAIDVARIRMDNPYWRSQPAGGFLLRINSSNVVQNSPSNIVSVVPSRSSIHNGDVLCLSALSPTYGDSCGTVTQAMTPNGQVRIGDYDACPGDSGGAWVWSVSPGQSYQAFGVHEGGRQGCPKIPGGQPNSSPNGFSVFTTIPDIYHYWDATSAATIRLDT